MSNEEDAAKTTLTAVEALGAVIKHAGESPEARAAASNLGKAAVTVTQALNNCLLPIAAVNYAFERGRRYFEERFADDLKEVTKGIPDDCVVEPKVYVAAPVLQGLAFSHDEAELKRLYLALLKSAMDTRTESVCHPAFADIIRQLTPEESLAVQSLLVGYGMVPIVNVSKQFPTSGRIVLFANVLSCTDEHGEETAYPEGPAMVSNVVRLGLFELTFDRQSGGQRAYEWCEQRPEYLEAKKTPLEEGATIVIDRGLLKRTPFGERFGKAVGILSATT